MIKPFLYIVFLVSFASTGQNLVPNGSFEEYSSCPEQNELGNGQFERCTGWYYSTPMNVGSPDYFNVCNNLIGGANQGMVGVPTNFWGYQQAYEGDGYIGLGMYEYSLSNSSVVGKEFASAHLLSKLKPCTEYKFEMYVSLANKASHGCSSIGIKVTNSDFSSSYLEDYLSLTSSWENSDIVFDTLNWTRLSTRFTAIGGEIILTIGHFAEYNETDVHFNDSSTILAFNSYLPYYYIDSVSLIELGEDENCTPTITNFFTPNGDLINDLYTIEGLNISEMIIFNRWGNVITILNEDQPIWDGSLNGTPCTEGNYFYRALFGENYLSGFIELIR